MNTLVDDLLNYPSSLEAIEPYLNNLRGKTDVILTFATTGTLNGASTTLLDTLREIPFARCTAGVALLLSLQSESLNTKTFPMFAFVCKAFFSDAPKSHILQANKEVTKVLQKLVVTAIVVRKPRSVINILLQAVALMSPNPNCLTTAHSLLLQAYIKGQVYDTAVSFIKAHDILEIDTKNAAISGMDFLKYFYYAGICYIAVNDYPAALASFFQCLSTPASALSSIVVCALKKAKLVALIHYGRELSVSAPMSGAVSRFVKAPLPVYDAIGKAFGLDDKKGVNVAIETGAEMLIKDGNLGLAQRVLIALTSHRLRRLCTTFISLSLQDIAVRLELDSPQQAERELLKAIRRGELGATVDPSTGFVLFRDDAGLCATSDHANGSPAVGASGGSSSGAGAHAMTGGVGGVGGGGLCSADAAKQLQTYLGETMALSQRLQELQRAAQQSTKYILKQTAAGRSSMSGIGGMGIMSMGVMDGQQMDMS